eukprot:509811-Pyramimonas_sp.AAC.1
MSWLHVEVCRRQQWWCPHVFAPPLSAPPSHASWPHGVPRRKPQWRCPDASAPPISARPA